ncbi:MAG: alpha/beta hydrolase [Chloroflexota bacterium]
MRWRRIILVALVVLVGMAGIAAFVWIQNAYQPTGTAVQALQSDAQVNVVQTNGSILFTPIEPSPSTGFIFYPGGGVDYRAYAPVLRSIAERGYMVGLVSVPLNLALLDTNAANKIIAATPEIEAWVVGGHSLGGVAAARFAEGYTVAGLALWASFPADEALRQAEFPAVLVYGTEDGLFAAENVAIATDRLPDEAIFVAIEGGNHAQFGAYGFQEGDSAATITPEAQWEQTADATVTLLQLAQNR